MHEKDTWSWITKPDYGKESKAMSKATPSVSNADVPLCKAPENETNDRHQKAAHKSWRGIV